MATSDPGKGDRDLSDALANRYDLDEGYEWPKERPLGVTVIAFLNWLGAALLALVTLVVWANIESRRNMSSSHFALGDRELFSVEQVGLFLTLALIEIALSIVIGVGLWKLKGWARPLAIGAYGLGLAALLWNNFADPVTGATLAGALFALGSIVYLMKPDVRDSFED